MPGSSIDSDQFRRILSRNVAMPLGMGVLSALVFVGIIAYLINVLSWVEHSEHVIGRANEVSRLSSDMEAGMRGYVLSGDDDFLAPYLTAKPRMDAELKNLERLVDDNRAQLDRIERVRAAQLQWQAFAEEMIGLRGKKSDFVEIIQNIKAGRGKILTDQVRREFLDFILEEQRILQERNATSRSVIAWSVAAFLAFSLIVAGLLAVFGRRDLQALSKSYGDILQHEEDHNTQLTQQAWLRSGQTELVGKTTGIISLETLADAVLNYVANYLNGVVAAMYVRADDGTLTRIGAYGFAHADTDRARIVHPTESLAAQAADQNRIVTLRDLPPDYIKVGSALGETAPRELLIAPVSNFGKIKGVIEIGFLHPVRERDVQFMETIAASVGAAVANVLHRQRLQAALEEQQALNEELQVQQEELRTANEELEEQSRALEESQSALENQQAELEQTNEQLAEQAANLDTKNSALVQAQEQLRERALELERASRYKSEFLANMSHELRTPLNSSLILAKLLADNAAGNLNDEQVRFAQTIYSAGNDLLNLINDILDISKVEAGKLELVPEDLPLRRVIEGLARVFEPLARQKHLDFSLTVEPDVPISIHTDRQRLEQILKNLLSNAVKFTDKGKVHLTVSANTDGWIQFTVQDSGIGIAPEQQDKIFDAFHQADGSTARKYGGTGLGLSISRDLTALLGGTLTLTSAPGEGSSFVLSLPRNGTVAATPPVL
ncbi:CHASE3 domain-containing protein, partial [Massilia sp. CT11-108]|uniref:CHASE3 domain-containing protein n=1 Tax=Massilia sp. CT11-108 TaxID=3393900 RepID=UPI0039A5383C